MNRHVIEMVMGSLLFIGSAPAVGAIDGPPGRRGHRGPPPEAIEACKDKNEGTEVGITNHHGEKMKATCKQINGQLVDVPEGGFRGPKGIPPGGPQNKE